VEQPEKKRWKDIKGCSLRNGMDSQLPVAETAALQGAGRGERRQLSAKALDLQSKSKGETAAKSRDRSGLQSDVKQRGTRQRRASRQGKEGANTARKRKERLNADSMFNTKMASSGKLRQDVMANGRKNQKVMEVGGVNEKHQLMKTAKHSSKKHKPGDSDEIDKMLTKRTRQLFGLSKKGSVREGTTALDSTWLQ
jgi:hypothetical protein